ncbi:hypothetical protein [Caballeronia sp. 15715]|uniref:hypothetical protein n=1 Tax=unclassified Caballeronia TaxID=2646786 RepID=UPI0039E5B42B
MKTIFILLLVLSASMAEPAIASGYGPAPFHRPMDGAPTSQRGQSTQTVAAEQRENSAATEPAYGGAVSESTRSGTRLQPAENRSIYSKH